MPGTYTTSPTDGIGGLGNHSSIPDVIPAGNIDPIAPPRIQLIGTAADGESRLTKGMSKRRNRASLILG